MRLISSTGGLALPCIAGLMLLMAGCAQSDRRRAASDDKKVQQTDTAAPGNGATSGADQAKHDGWWCDEHGIPEKECSMCSKKVADAFKAKGDWCEKHDRARSQCFKCDPSLREQFAARYRAKYNGKEPPPIEDD